MASVVTKSESVSTDRAPNSSILEGTVVTSGGAEAPTHTDKGFDSEKQVYHPLDEKEPVASPLREPDIKNGLDKETFSRATDSSKEVVSPISTVDDDADTSKIVVPQAPPISMGLEVAAPPSSAAQAIIPPSYEDLTSTASTSGSGKHNVIGFRLEKKHALGLIAYQNQQIAIHPLNVKNNQLGPCAFVTSSMAFIEAMLGQPPMFDLFVPNTVPTITAGRWMPLGLEGLIRMRGEVEVPIHRSTAQDPENSTNTIEKWEMRRKGVIWPGRTYDLWRSDPNSQSNDTKRSPDLAWKGSTRTVRDTLKKNNLEGLQLAGGAGESTRHGSLKLVDHSAGDKAEPLALWNQWRGGDTLGDLLIFEAVAREKISVEAIIVTAIAVVHAERITGMHWVGGLGKA